MINKIRILILLITLGMCTMSSVTYAAECTEETKQAAREEAKTSAQKACAALKSDAEAYNSLVEEYMNSCDSNLPAGKPIVPSQDVISASEQIGESIADPKLYQYRSITWQFINPPLDKPNCAETIDKVRAAKQKYDSTVINAQQLLPLTANDAMNNCKCDENGVPDCSVVKPSGEIGAEDGECQIKGYLNTLNSCPLCKIFETIMNTNASIAHLSWQATAEPLSKTVSIFFLVLLAFEALKAVASIGGIKPSAIMKSVLLLCLKFGIVLALLSNSQYIYGLFISPVLQGGLEMGLAVAESAGGGNCSIEEIGSISSEEISPELFNTVIGTVRCFSKDAATMPAIGMGLICRSETFAMFLSGLIIVFFGFMIWLAFSFYLLDATVQLGMLCALVPLLIACWPFEMTKQYTSKGVRMLMNSFFTFTFAGVLIMMAVSYVTAAITGGGETATSDLINAINNEEKEPMEHIAALEGASILTLITCCIFAMKMIGNVSALATQLAGGGSGMSFGAKLGGIATSAASGAAKWAGGKATKLAGAGLKLASDKTGLTAAAKRGMGAVQRGWGQGWARVGQVAGLGRFQNRNAGSAAQTQGRDATPGDKPSSLQDQIRQQQENKFKGGREYSDETKQHIADSLTRADQLLQDLDAGGAKEEAAREELKNLGIDYNEIQAGVGSGARDEDVRAARDKIATKMRINDRANNSGGSGDGGSNGGNGDNNTTTNNNNSGDNNNGGDNDNNSGDNNNGGDNDNNSGDENNGGDNDNNSGDNNNGGDNDNNSGDENSNNEENEQEQELEAKEEKEQEEKEEQEKAEEMKGYYTEMTGELGEDGSNSGGEDTVTTIDRSSDGDNGGEGGSGGGESGGGSG